MCTCFCEEETSEHLEELEKCQAPQGAEQATYCYLAMHFLWEVTQALPFRILSQKLLGLALLFISLWPCTAL